MRGRPPAPHDYNRVWTGKMREHLAKGLSYKTFIKLIPYKSLTTLSNRAKIPLIENNYQ